MSVLTGHRVDLNVVTEIHTGTFKCSMMDGTGVIVHVPHEYHDVMMVTKTATVLGYTVSLKQNDIHLHVNHETGGRIFLHPSLHRGENSVAELFGGLSGWGHASRHLGAPVQIVVEKDMDTALACAATLETSVLTPSDFFQASLKGTFVGPVVVCGCVTDTLIWSGMSMLNVGTILASPPCPPWSGSGVEAGLSCVDGQVFRDMMALCGQSRISHCLVENVPGIVKHPDFSSLIAHAAMNGMKLYIDGVQAVSRVSPVYRERWLATFIHSSIIPGSSQVSTAQAINFASAPFSFTLPGPTMKSAKVIDVLMNADTRVELAVSDDAMLLLERCDMIPRWLNDKVNWSSTRPVLDARTISEDEPMKGIMAQYGSQHELPINHLLNKGLQTQVFRDPIGYRYFSPHEILAALGFPPTTVISSDIKKAWKQSGNAISVHHAFLQLFRTHVLLGPGSPFTCDDPAEIVRKIQQNTICLHVHEPMKDENLWRLQVREVQMSEAVQPFAKKQRTEVSVSPTIPFHVAEQMQAQSTHMLSFEPDFALPMLGSREIGHQLCQGGMVTLKHFQKHWMTVVHGLPRETLQTLVVRALPHAQKSHFACFHMNDDEVQWDQEINCVPACVIDFKPVPLVFTCVCEPLDTMFFDGDVTWTVSTLLAFMAQNLRRNVESLTLRCNDLPTLGNDFLALYEPANFQVKFKATMPGYVAFRPSDMSLKDHKLAPRLNTEIRLVTKSPTHKSTRTLCVPDSGTVATAVQMLFPDLCENTAWQVSVDGQDVASNAPLRGLIAFQVEWKGYRPLQPCDVQVSHYRWSVESPETQVKWTLNPQRWIRSPFRTKAQILRVDEDESIMQIAASFVSHSQLATNIMCQVGGRVIDPATLVRNVPLEEVLNFKITPLLGGAKQQHESVKQRIQSALETHGVSHDKSADRMLAFAAKADLETLAKVISNDDMSFWTAVKDEANRIRFRLVYRSELNSAKKDARSKPPAKFDKKPNQPKGKIDFVPNATNVKIDIANFVDGMDALELIEPSRFGQDKCGLAIMGPSEANKYPLGQKLSVDALAILVIGQTFSSSDEPFHMPAYTKDGTPIIIRAALRQYGDRPVSFKAMMPEVQVSHAASTVVELHIVRKEVSSWRDCSVPLHYLGVHVSAVRGDNLISTWSMKTWSDERKPVPFKDAAYWHGFFRVADEILDQVLARSGIAGIYTTPKSESKRHDERFSVVTMPNKSLQDMQKLAAMHEKALGIVRVKDQYAVRCRREFAPMLRSHLLPESAFVATDTVAADDEMWVLKHVPPIGKQGLDDALVQAKWNARTIRAQGLNRWLVAAKSPPASQHMCINGSIVLIEPLKRSADPQALTVVAKQVKVETVVNGSDGSMTATSSRFQEIRAEMSEQFEQKMALAHQRIESLAAKVDQVQAQQVAATHQVQSDMLHLKEEQQFSKQKISEVEASIVTSGQNIIQTMQAMMQKMQTGIENNMIQLLQPLNDESKRPRVDA